MNNNTTHSYRENITPLLASGKSLKIDSVKEKNNINLNQNKINILYVDDDEISLLIFKTIFKDKYNIFTSLTTSKAREILARESIDIIVSDHYMPKETGRDFFKSISAHYKDTINILLTSHASTLGYISKALASGEIWAHVIKPVEGIELVNTFKKAEKLILSQRKNKQ